MRGKKRRNNILKEFALDKKDDVKRYVIHRKIQRGEKTYYKAPKIQRLITDTRLRRKRVMKQTIRKRGQVSKDAAAAYEKLLSQYAKEKKAARHDAAHAEKAKKAE